MTPSSDQIVAGMAQTIAESFARAGLGGANFAKRVARELYPIAEQMFQLRFAIAAQTLAEAERLDRLTTAARVTLRELSQRRARVDEARAALRAVEFLISGLESALMRAGVEAVAESLRDRLRELGEKPETRT